MTKKEKWETITSCSRANGKSYKIFIEAIKQAQNGKSIMYAHPNGNVAIIDWDEYDRIKTLLAEKDKEMLRMLDIIEKCANADLIDKVSDKNLTRLAMVKYKIIQIRKELSNLTNK